MVSFWNGFKQWAKFEKQEMEIRNLAVGINSTVDLTKDLHIIMLDYDIKDKALVVESVMELQDFWHLSDAWIYSTKNGYHVYFFHDIVPYGRLKLIIEYARYVDPMYKYISRYYDHKTIRAAGKYKEQDIIFIERLKGVRVPTAIERELGDMKMNERNLLAKTS
jgi:hypothetical protein